MSWMIVLNGMHLSVKNVDDPYTFSERIEKDPKFIEIQKLLEKDNFKIFAQANSEQNIVDVILGLELLPDRYILKGETVSFNNNFDPIVLRQYEKDLIKIISDNIFMAEVLTSYGFIVNHFD